MPDGYFDSLPIPRKNVDLAGMQQNIANLQSGLAQEILDRESADATKADKSTTINGKSLEENRTLYVQDIPSKNLLPNNASTQTINGVTFTVNADGSISTSGTASAGVEFFIYANGYLSPSPYPFDKSNQYILSGCPTGGTDSTYSIRIYEYNGSSSTGNYKDYGSGVTFTPNASGTGCLVMIAIQSGQNMNGKTFRPMIRLASIEDDSYVPYAKTNVELTEYVLGKITPVHKELPAVTATANAYKEFGTYSIPANNIAILQIRARYVNAAPSGIKVSDENGSSFYQIIAASELSSAVTVVVYAYNAITLHIFAKYPNVSSNRCDVDGILIKRY